MLKLNTRNKLAESSNKLDQKFISEFLEVQKQKAKNEASAIDVQKQDLDHQANYAKDLLAKQHDLLKTKPSEDRKSIALYSIISIGLYDYYKEWKLKPIL